MGVIRGGLLVIVSVLLFLAFLTGSIFLTLDLSLDYNNVKEEMGRIVEETISAQVNLQEVINGNFEFMQTYCQNFSEFVFSEQGQTFVVPCSVVAEGPERVLEEGLDNFVERAYYKEYTCGFWKCVTQEAQPFVLVSKTAKDYWHGKFYILLIISLILLGLMFLLVEHKPSMLIIAGALLVASSFIFRKLEGIFAYIDKALIEFTGLFFARSGEVFLITFIIGIVALIVGIIFRFLTWDLIKKKFSKKDVQNMVKKEVSKAKEENKNVGKKK